MITNFWLVVSIILFSIYYYLFYYEGFKNELPDYVFIIIRHVNSELTNKYWKESYRCIRKFYPDIKVIIIDDNSDTKYLNNENIHLKNVEIIKSEYPARGELLPYYYFYKNKFAKKAVILHDSVFIQEKINFDTEDVKFLWHHGHYFDNIKEEKEKILALNEQDNLYALYDSKDEWLLSCGVMSVIDYNFLKKMVEKYNFFNLLDVTKTRLDRMCLERIFGLLCHAIKPELVNDPSFFGIQYEHKYSYYDYLIEKTRGTLNKKVVKVFTGR